MSEIVSAALDYASQGFPVLPIHFKAGKKVPTIKAWPDLASTDPVIVERWWGPKGEHATCGVACLTGSRSRHITIDVDVKNVDGFRAFQQLGIDDLNRVPTVVTPSGGKHFHFRLPPGRIVRGGANMLGPGVDIRAENNCIVMPPSRLDPARPAYAWVNDVRLTGALLLPSHILDLLQRQRDKYHQALVAACESVRTSPPTTRHQTIRDACWELARHILSGKLRHGEAVVALSQAAGFVGHDHYEVENALESAVRKQGSGSFVQKNSVVAEDVEPWNEPVVVGEVLDGIVAAIHDHIVIKAEAAIAQSLWIVHAHCIASTDYTPRIRITSPEKRCGKTTLLRVISKLVPRPLLLSAISAPALFRTIGNSEKPPVLLLDEADNAGFDRNDDLRIVFNAGVDRGATIGRVTGENHEPRMFSIFAPAVVAGIGKLPGPLMDRSIPIELRRKLKSEVRRRFDRRKTEHLTVLCRQAARFAIDRLDDLAAADPEVPEELNDRELDNWRPLLAIADLAGGEWPQLARAAARSLSGSDAGDDEPALMLLMDCRAVFEQLRCDLDGSISSAKLVEYLRALPDRPWADWGMTGRPISAHSIARLLKKYHITPGLIGPVSRRERGYAWIQFADPWMRYCRGSS